MMLTLISRGPIYQRGVSVGQELPKAKSQRMEPEAMHDEPNYTADHMSIERVTSCQKKAGLFPCGGK